MSADPLENYVMKITEPIDYTLDYMSKNNQPELVIELISDDSDGENFYPKIPEHSEGNQHLNFGLDLFSAINCESIPLSPHYHYAVIRTGVKIQLPYGYHMMIGSRSGLGFKNHIQAFPGIIDHSYRGEVLIKIYSPVEFSISSGDKIAQGLIFSSLPYTITQGVVDTNTTRGSRGFGSTDP
jgi:deoxyuridine 5'-triphosphate nucleotidohydrolase